ncbi:hypothetical protein, partial [Amycolatopsis lexingtonensis]|uniref:hypothetical protein n=1 Tax=Amycolatopsis lexingtonensis TaxID=218822 RepID=UPI001B8098B5
MWLALWLTSGDADAATSGAPDDSGGLGAIARVVDSVERQLPIAATSSGPAVRSVSPAAPPVAGIAAGRVVRAAGLARPLETGVAAAGVGS